MKMYSIFLIILFFTAFSFQVSYALDDSVTNSDGGQDQQAFPFDDQCLKYDKDNFKVGSLLLDVMRTGDFPQYCVLYSLSNYQIKQKNDEGYFIVGSKLDLKQADATIVVLKSKNVYQQNQVLAANDSAVYKPAGQWAYFVGPERFDMGEGAEKEYYVFQEIDFQN